VLIPWHAICHEKWQQSWATRAQGSRPPSVC
jgi:hypothetical protein